MLSISTEGPAVLRVRREVTRESFSGLARHPGPELHVTGYTRATSCCPLGHSVHRGLTSKSADTCACPRGRQHTLSLDRLLSTPDAARGNSSARSLEGKGLKAGTFGAALQPARKSPAQWPLTHMPWHANEGKRCFSEPLLSFRIAYLVILTLSPAATLSKRTVL